MIGLAALQVEHVRALRVGGVPEILALQDRGYSALMSVVVEIGRELRMTGSPLGTVDTKVEPEYVRFILVDDFFGALRSLAS